MQSECSYKRGKGESEAEEKKAMGKKQREAKSEREDVHHWL